MPRPSRRDLMRLAATLPAARLLESGTTPARAGQQEESADPVAVHASGLFNPRGLAFAADGTLYVALAGNGQMHEAPGVVKIADGCPVTVIHGQPSTMGMSGAVQGVGAVAFLGDQLYLLQDSEDDRGDLATTQPNGVYKAEADGTASLLADITAWMIANPTREIPKDRGKLGETYAMLAGDGFLWVVESNEGQVLKVTPDGAISRVADLSEGHPVPSGCALAPDGGLFVGNLTDTPYPQGEAKVWHVAADGSATVVWSGLTMVTALAVVDGTLYACEMATANTTQPPYTRPGTGRVVRQTGSGTLEEVVSGLDFPIAMAAGPDGMLYVSTPALGSAGPAGAVLRIDPASTFLTPPADLYEDATCPGFQEARAGLLAAFAKMTTEADAIVKTAEATPPPNTAPVTIRNFAFDPPQMRIAVGRSVTWTNEDPVPHTATSTATPRAFDSGNLDQGQSFSFAFDKPGTYPYLCIYHPYMKGTVIVE